MITQFQADVLDHTSRTGRYMTGQKRVLEIAEAGLLFDHGPQVLADGDNYLVMTPAGREALSEWRDAQPKPPKPKKRRVSLAFQEWERYCDAFGWVAFGEFWKRRKEGAP